MFKLKSRPDISAKINYISEILNHQIDLSILWSFDRMSYDHFSFTPFWLIVLVVLKSGAIRNNPQNLLTVLKLLRPPEVMVWTFLPIFTSRWQLAWVLRVTKIGIREQLFLIFDVTYISSHFSLTQIIPFEICWQSLVSGHIVLIFPCWPLSIHPKTPLSYTNNTHIASTPPLFGKKSSLQIR